MDMEAGFCQVGYHVLATDQFSIKKQCKEDMYVCPLNCDITTLRQEGWILPVMAMLTELAWSMRIYYITLLFYFET